MAGSALAALLAYHLTRDESMYLMLNMPIRLARVGAVVGILAGILVARRPRILFNESY